METIYLILVVVLFLLAISDLVVGVSNDAVNFLNSAIGSKAASFKVIMLIAALGVLVGATFSSGMMEVARKGIFNPNLFLFAEIMIIFLAVMITDVILLDTFNSLGLPTSTTVSIVFELLGAAVGVSMIKIYTDPQALGIHEYINTAKAMAIIGGILLSVVVSFSVGALVQYFARLWFTFNFQKNIKRFGALWGGIAITAITYFILIKGAKGASFMTDEMKEWVKNNSLLIIGGSFAFWTVLLQLISWVSNFNVLRFTVLVGTFALAMAFAGNDLVNFIGVPLAGFHAFKAWMASGVGVDELMMTSLSKKVATPTYMLLIAGFIMVLTLFLSKKSKNVVKTSLNLSRQDEGEERFGSSLFARALVRSTRKVGQTLSVIVPPSVSRTVERRFDQTEYIKSVKNDPEAPAFDLLRASVILVVSSILISFATSKKLPLSTTYVTFMVAMGASLADRAWGRESAVYRITGVLSVIGGWFFTALSAFTFSFVVACLFSFGTYYAIFGMVAVAVFAVYRTHTKHKKKMADESARKEEEMNLSSDIFNRCTNNVTNILNRVIGLYGRSLEALIEEDRKTLKETTKEVGEINERTKYLKDNIFKTVQKLQEDSVDTGLYYVQVLDYLRETAHCMTYISGPAFKHIDNQHKGLLKDQVKELKEVNKEVSDLLNQIVELITKNDFSQLDAVIAKQQEILSFVEATRKKQIKRIKKEEAGTRNSMLYLNMLHESKNILLNAINLVKAQRDFVDNGK